MRQKNKMLVCVACPKGSDAELLHPALSIPICGSCNAALKDADQSVSADINGHMNNISCCMCGMGDGCELFMCDKCPKSFCTDCVDRCFGSQEAEEIRAAAYWECYLCSPTDRFKSLQVRGQASYFNIDKAYSSVRPPDGSLFEGIDLALADQLSDTEKAFASLFCNGLVNSSIQDLNIAADYLKAGDVLSVMYRVSPTLRRFFRSKVFLTPGLFKTSYGIEQQCRLHPHQLAGLNCMTHIESAASEFGALRGGIFGDEPGLGKTVTCLALISASAGTNPAQPAAFWDSEKLSASWAAMTGQHTQLLLPLINSLKRSYCLGPRDHFAFEALIRSLEEHCATIDTLEQKVREVIREVAKDNLLVRDKLLDTFRQGMNSVKEKLDSAKRKEAQSMLSARVKYERALKPSHGTLIIVPQALLEHWYEQIKRHLNLAYFTRSSKVDDSGEPDCRGIVYMDGLGDIMDVAPPLVSHVGSLKAEVDARQAEELAHYLIVVTTFERCAMEFRHGKEYHHGTKGAVTQQANRVPLLQIRWLRLVVDEGHEVGQLRRRDLRGSDGAVGSEAAMGAMSSIGRFISQIAAERRWIMSGTPTTGANSELGLTQLYRLLSFLRHPLIVEQDAAAAVQMSPDGTRVTKRAKKRNGDAGVCSPASVSSPTAVTATLSSCSQPDYWTEVPSPSSPHPSTVTLTPSKTKSVRYNGSADYWQRAVMQPCLQQKAAAWTLVAELLKTILVRHTKDDLNLYPPVASTVNLDALPVESDSPEERHMLGIDRAKAAYIAQTMLAANREWKEFMRTSSSGGRGSESDGFTPRKAISPVRRAVSRVAAAPDSQDATDGDSVNVDNKALTREELVQHRRRRPKAIIFSQFDSDLQGVGHFLYTRLGDSYLCEHFGAYQSNELSRFRHSKRKFRHCPLCGFDNVVSHERSCAQPLLMVEYLDVEEQEEGGPAVEKPQPTPSGHGASGPGGHYKGMCLCCPEGCGPHKSDCAGFVNAFHTKYTHIVNPNCALVAAEHITGWEPGAVNWTVDQVVHVKSVDAVDPQSAAYATTPLLWRDGVMGGRASIRSWRKCGGTDTKSGWHGERVLKDAPWRVEEEPACLLLLKEDGSTGLDLSFATHIFLLERIKDPALRNQIVSRAHRMGATGPVHVQLIQVKSEEG